MIIKYNAKFKKKPTDLSQSNFSSDKAFSSLSSNDVTCQLTF
jgi:hypothetical protein